MLQGSVTVGVTAGNNPFLQSTHHHHCTSHASTASCPRRPTATVMKQSRYLLASGDSHTFLATIHRAQPHQSYHSTPY